MYRFPKNLFLGLMLVFLGASAWAGDLPSGESARESAPALDVMLVMDNSGSMRKNDPEFLTRKVVANFLEDMPPQTRLGLVVFDQKARLAVPLVELSRAEVKEDFLNKFNQVDYRGLFTNSAAGLERAIYELKQNGPPGARKVIIFLTDGILDTGDRAKDEEQDKWMRTTLSQDAKLSAIGIFGVAFTDTADFRMIQTLAVNTGGEYYRAFKAEDIAGVFNKIKERITKPAEPAPAPAPPPGAAARPAEAKPEQVQTEKAAPSVTGGGQPPSAKAEKTESQERRASVPADKEPTPVGGKGGLTWLWIALGIAGLLVVIVLAVRKKRPAEKEEGPAEPAVPAKPRPRAFLKDLDQVTARDEIVMEADLFRVGRSDDENLELAVNRPTVSGFHATIAYEPPFFYLEDQRSLNGTRLNGEPLEAGQRVRLKSGDEISFDRFRFLFVMPDEAAKGGTQLAGAFTVRSAAENQDAGPDGTPEETAPQAAGQEAPDDSGIPSLPNTPPAPDGEEVSPPLEGSDSFPEDAEAQEARDQPAGQAAPRADETAEEAAEVAAPEAPSEPSREQPRPTVVKQGAMCPNHPSRRAEELCSQCLKAYCPDCMVEKDGELICKECAGE